MDSKKNAAVIIIGNEILSGKVKDQNSPFLANELFKLGIRVQKIIIIPDIVDEIAREINYLKDWFNFIFTSGGMGPTHDDVTVEGLAKGMDRKLILDPVLEKCIKNYYKNPTKIHYKLAMVPEGTTVVADEKLNMPIIHYENIFLFPGIPKLLQKQFNYLRKRFQGNPIHHLTLDLNVAEVKIAAYLEEILYEFSEVEIGSYPSLLDYKCKVHLTFCSGNLKICNTAREKLKKIIPQDWILEEI